MNYLARDLPHGTDDSSKALDARQDCTHAGMQKICRGGTRGFIGGPVEPLTLSRVVGPMNDLAYGFTIQMAALLQTKQMHGLLRKFCSILSTARSSPTNLLGYS